MKAIIVEDNPSVANVLRTFISEYRSEIEILEIADSIEVAQKLIHKFNPELWFLDIQINDKTIFDLLKMIENRVITNSAVIFITAYYTPEYLHQALKYSALDYITKPIDQEQLFLAIDKAIEKVEDTDLVTRMSRLEKRVLDIQLHTGKNKIPIHRANDNIDYIDSKELLYIKTENKISKLHFSDSIISTTKPLKFYNNLLDNNDSFIRISKDVILNMDWIKSYNPKGREVLLDNNDTLLVSRRQAVLLLNKIEGSG